MSQVRTYGRRPTLGEAKEYYDRQDVLEFLSYACKKRKVFFSFKAEPSRRSESGSPPLEVQSPEHLHQIIMERIEENMRDMADDARPIAYPSFHGITSKDGGEVSDFVMEADCQGWRRSFADVRGAVEILNEFGVPYIAKFSGHRSLHVMIPREAFPREFEGKSRKSLESGLRGFFRSIALVRHAHGTGGILRLPYSLNENTGMVSLPINHEMMNNFRPWEAFPHLVPGILSRPFDVSEDGRNRMSQFLHAALIEKRIVPLPGRIWQIRPKEDLDKYRHLVDDTSSTRIDSDDPTQRAEAAWKLMVSRSKIPDNIVQGYTRERNPDVRWFIAEALTGDDRISELLRESDEYAVEAVIDAAAPIMIPFLRRLLSDATDWEPSGIALANIRSVFERSGETIENEIVQQAEIVHEAKAPMLLKYASLIGASKGGWETVGNVADLLEKRFPGMEAVVSRDVFDNVGVLLETDVWENRHEREDAANALLAAGKRATDALIMAMASAEHWTRRAVIGILCKVGDPKASQCLVDALGDPGRKIRNMAVSGVVKLGRESDEIKKLLIEASESDNPRLRANAIRALRLIDNKTSEPLEIALKSLDDLDPKVRRAGIKSLGKIGGKRAIDGLERALADEDRGVAINAAFALSDMGDEAEEVLREALKENSVQIARCAAHALAELGDTSGIQLVIDAFNDDTWDVWCTPFSLAESGDERAVEALIRYIEHSLSMGALPSKTIRAVKALGDCASERAVDMLETVMYRNRDRKLRRATVMALQKIGTEKAVDMLLRALVSGDGNLRQHARNALIKTGPDILPKLRRLVDQTEGKMRRSVESLIQAI